MLGAGAVPDADAHLRVRVRHVAGPDRPTDRLTDRPSRNKTKGGKGRKAKRREERPKGQGKGSMGKHGERARQRTSTQRDSMTDLSLRLRASQTRPSRTPRRSLVRPPMHARHPSARDLGVVSRQHEIRRLLRSSGHVQGRPGVCVDPRLRASRIATSRTPVVVGTTAMPAAAWQPSTRHVVVVVAVVNVASTFDRSIKHANEASCPGSVALNDEQR